MFPSINFLSSTIIAGSSYHRSSFAISSYCHHGRHSFLTTPTSIIDQPFCGNISQQQPDQLDLTSNIVAKSLGNVAHCNDDDCLIKLISSNNHNNVDDTVLSTTKTESSNNGCFTDSNLNNINNKKIVGNKSKTNLTTAKRTSKPTLVSLSTSKRNILSIFNNNNGILWSTLFAWCCNNHKNNDKNKTNYNQTNTINNNIVWPMKRLLNQNRWLKFAIEWLEKLINDLMETFIINIINLLFHPNMLLTYLILISYWPSLWAEELVFDDQPAIIHNKDIRPDTSWYKIWLNDYWGTPLKSPSSHKSYRPLTVITFRINYLLHQLRPFGYHLVNVLLHSIVTILCYSLCQRFQLSFWNSNESRNIKAQNLTDQSFVECCSKLLKSWNNFQWTPFLIAAIFAVHPIHTDCVSSVVGRAELLSAIFYLLSILSWDQNYFYSTPSPLLLRPLPKQWLIVLDEQRRSISILFALIGFLCKEQSIFVLIYLAIHHLIGGGAGDRSSPASPISSSTLSTTSLSFSLKRTNINGLKRMPVSMSSMNNVVSGETAPSPSTSPAPPPSSSSPAAAVVPTSSSTSTKWPMFRPMLLPATPSTTNAMTTGPMRINKKFKVLAILALVFISITYVRFVLMGHSFPIFNRFDNPASRAFFPIKQLTYAYQALYHYWLMLYPNELSCDWTHASIELIDFDPNSFYMDVFLTAIILSLFGFIIINIVYLSSLVFAHKQKMFPRNCFRARFRIWPSMANASSRPVWPASNITSPSSSTTRAIRVHLARKLLKTLALTIVPFLPVSNLFFPVGFVIAERVLYLPSIGFLLLFGQGIDYLLFVSSRTCVNNNNNNGYKDTGKKYENVPAFCTAHQSLPNTANIRSMFNENNRSKFTIGVPSMARIKITLIYLSLTIIILAFSLKTFYRSYNWTNEYTLYESGLKVNPRNTKLLNNLGRLHEKNNLTNKAIDLYQKAIIIEPKDLRSYLNLGNIFAKKQKKQEAEKLYRQALIQADEVMEPFGLRFNLNDRSSINIDYYQQLSLSPLYLTALIRLAELLADDESKADDLRIIQNKIIQIQSINNAALGTTSCDEHCKYTELGTLDSGTLDQLYNLGVVHYQQRNLQKALHYFEQVLTFNPYHEHSLLTSAQIIQDENIHQLKHVAFNRLNKLVKLGKADETIYFNLAILAVNNHKFILAENLFEKAIAKRDNFVEAHYNLALLLIKQINHLEPNANKQRDNLAKAIDHLQRVLSINPKHENSMFILGELYADELNELNRSQYYYQMIIDNVNPFNLQAKHNLCVLWHKRGFIDESIQCFQNILQELLEKNLDDIQQFQLTIEEQISILLKIKQMDDIHSGNLLNGPSQQRHRLDRTINESCQNISDKSADVYQNLFVSNYRSTMCFI